MTAPESPHRFFFLHLHKTGGTTLSARLRGAFGPDAVYPIPSDGSFPNVTLVPEQLAERWRVRGSEIRVITGHFPLCTTELLDGEFVRFTVVRDPVERVLSALRDHKQRGGAADQTLEQIYDDPIRQLMVRNHMVKMLSLTTEEMTDGVLTAVEFDEARTERAKRALDSLDLVGHLDRLETFAENLADRYGLELAPDRRMNTSRPEPTPPTSLVERIREENAADLEVYEYALSLAL